MRFYKHPDAYCKLRNLYWMLRATRSYDTAARRKWYRRIRIERDRLVVEGATQEHVRLYCRYLSNPLSDSPALRRLQAYEAAVVEYAQLEQRVRMDVQRACSTKGAVTRQAVATD